MSEQNTGIAMIFDSTAILAGRSREWQEYSRLGQCFLPEVVQQEMVFLCNRASEPEEEAIAREFTRFLGSSGWNIARHLADLPEPQAITGENISKSARLQQAVAQTVVGFCQEQGDRLVVVISNRSALRDQLQTLNLPNLATLTANQLLQWARTQHKPLEITQKLALLSSAPSSQPITAHSAPRPSVAQHPIPPPITRPTPQSLGSNAIATIGTVVGLAIAGLAVWYFVQPSSFQKNWDSLGLPGHNTNSKFKINNSK